jgi:FeS assembly SUF system protein
MKHVNVSPPIMRGESNPVRVSLEDQMLQKTKEIEASITPEQDVEIDDSMLAANVIDALREIYDPEIPVNIYDLGLIYKVQIEKGYAEVDMTLTTPGCPVAQSFPGMVESSIRKVAGVKGASVELVWDPPWTQDKLSEEARLQLGLI